MASQTPVVTTRSSATVSLRAAIAAQPCMRSCARRHEKAASHLLTAGAMREFILARFAQLKLRPYRGLQL